MVLVVPTLTPTVKGEAQAHGWTLESLGDGYYEVGGRLPYAGYVIVLGEVADAEKDALLGTLSKAKLERLDAESRLWIMANISTSPDGTKLSDLEGYDEILRSFLASLTPAERLAGLDPAERLAGLDPAELASLQERIHKRLNGDS